MHAPNVDAAPSVREQMNIVIVGHVDHGKSTLVGRLLADTGSLPQGKLEHARAICDRQGKVFEYAFLLDALEAEQDQGITIDSARCFFKTDARDYIIIDAPGHIEFLKNMISGAARAEAALLLIDAKEGVRENSRRHGYVLGLLGIRQVTVVVNKMDLVGCDKDVFDAIEAEYSAFLAECGMVPQRFIPISARDGDNVATPSDRMPWYHGPTVLEAVDLFRKAAPKRDQPLRMPVQDVYKFNLRGDDRRIVAGRVESGHFQVGDAVVFSPSNKITTIASVEAFSAPPTDHAAAPDVTGVTLAEQLFIQRGELMSHLGDRPLVSTRFRANIMWLARQPMVQGRDYKLRLATTAMPCRIHRILSVLDASELTHTADRAEIGRHDVAEVILETRRPIAFDPIDRFEATGRFVIVDGYDLAGGGIIREAVDDDVAGLREVARRRDFEWAPGHISRADRVQRNGHEAGLVLVTGPAGIGKAAMARVLEQLLFERGCCAYLLDGKNVFLGLDADMLGALDKAEMLRRYAEVAHLFVDAGQIVVSTSNTFGLADHAAMRTVVGAQDTLHVHIGDDDGEADVVLPPELGPEEGAATVFAALVERAWIGPAAGPAAGV
ncbi:MAG: adenylyl-sulfate kinase [Deltaproteobacteria bacterium]|nr:MAG: adenylyl-sulfate kinase [Deltaproteobacteria bacterium]